MRIAQMYWIHTAIFMVDKNLQPGVLYLINKIKSDAKINLATRCCSRDYCGIVLKAEVFKFAPVKQNLHDFTKVILNLFFVILFKIKN